MSNASIAAQIEVLATKATALPWKGDTNVDDDRFGIYPDTGKMEFPTTWLPEIMKPEVNSANAALILALVNNLPAIVTALRQAEGRCTALPDHADILETIENAADDWQKNGYTSALAEVRDMANIGRSLMEALPEGYSYCSHGSAAMTNPQHEALVELGSPVVREMVRQRMRREWLQAVDLGEGITSDRAADIALEATLAALSATAAAPSKWKAPPCEDVVRLRGILAALHYECLSFARHEGSPFDLAMTRAEVEFGNLRARAALEPQGKDV